ncbi:hypothetical protein GXP67_31875 [Rhodocytophaga rosea]|uniref:Uncharacterized protein n=1 Tax=Rhodocytophaga rosea TaxID=2704465 RepID=A0A6C0GS50_9BACT|nr:hypothetical protein [Rhodocytophaga rosea]QHT70921.1 hypothetical protein GXP67_31875 [Rhodocytophaga rosea]
MSKEESAQNKVILRRRESQHQEAQQNKQQVSYGNENATFHTNGYGAEVMQAMYGYKQGIPLQTKPADQTTQIHSTPSPVIQREGWKDLDVIGGLLHQGAKFNFSVQLPKTLLDHYRDGNGTEFGLTSLGMTQCNALIDFGNDKRSPQFLRFVNQMGAEIARNAGSDPTRLKESIESDVSFSMLGACNTSGTLGNFTVYAWGKLKVWNPDADGTNADWSFDGSMWWYDLWDFDHRAASGKGEPGRTSTGSWRTDVGSLLVGTPFEIKSATVAVHQARAEAKGGNNYAKWEGNPEGKLMPVVSGIL